MKTAQALSFLFVAGALVASPRPTHASTVMKLGLRDLSLTAELIADAEVVAIQQRNSDVVEPGDADLPHTFVTFAIHQSIKGRSSAGDTITLRFLGGPNGRGQVTMVPGMPEFRVGDRDILFIRHNGTTMCPVFGWERGRLRLVRDGVYDELGREVWVTPAGELAAGERRIDVRSMGYPQLAPEPALHADEATRTFVPPTGALLPNASGMRAVIGQILTEARANGKLTEPATVPSQNPSALLRVPRFRSMAPPADPVTRTRTRPELADDDDR